MRPRRSEAEESILAAAMELLAQVGYDRMSMDLVARRAKASKATIYRRWTGKADLVRCAITRQTGQVIEPSEPPEPTGTLRGDLLELLRAVRGSALDAYRLVAGFPPVAELYDEVVHASREQVAGACLTGLRSVLGRPDHGARLAPAQQVRLAVLVCALIWDRTFTPDTAVDDAFLTETVDEVLVPLITTWQRTDKETHQ